MLLIGIFGDVIISSVTLVTILRFTYCVKYFLYSLVYRCTCF